MSDIGFRNKTNINIFRIYVIYENKPFRNASVYKLTAQNDYFGFFRFYNKHVLSVHVVMVLKKTYRIEQKQPLRPSNPRDYTNAISYHLLCKCGCSSSSSVCQRRNSRAWCLCTLSPFRAPSLSCVATGV